MPRKKSKPDIQALFDALAANNPNPKSELDFRNPFELVVAVALSAQATDVGVNKATPGLFAAAPTPQKMVALGVEGIKQKIRTIGLFNNKAKNIYALSQMLIDEFGGEVPEDLEALQRLPGVGRKTANVVMNVGFGHPTLAVDTHVFRVANRTGLAHAKTPDATEQQLLKIVPPEHALHAHHHLILHGRYVCKARAPQCDACDITAWCDEFKKRQKAAKPAAASQTSRAKRAAKATKKT
ncbi:endonuclease III [Magnetofaba australis]|uniref:Endonuclease III n=1 Tax=Magnetofaba australis IT-1 TaxID=1434232 RepID=A0A1Y2K5M5_9PROT|nr:endonuclease III [Magnetofaba australis]OSM04324.1 putative DNA-(apurinic or apyrimidinic site) lyase [Magnetofaba australis IT-1]